MDVDEDEAWDRKEKTKTDRTTKTGKDEIAAGVLAEDDYLPVTVRRFVMVERRLNPLLKYCPKWSDFCSSEANSGRRLWNAAHRNKAS